MDNEKVIIGGIIVLLAISLPSYAFITSNPYAIQSIGLSMGLLALLILLPVSKTPSVKKKSVKMGENLDDIVARILSAETEIKIVSGEAHPSIYDNTKMINAMKKAHDRGVQIKIICGPTIAIKNGSSKERKLLDLAKDGVIDLYMPHERQTEHFTLIDRNYVYREDYHDMLAERRTATVIENSFWEANRLETKFDRNQRECDRHTSKHPCDFNLLSESEIRAAEYYKNLAR